MVLSAADVAGDVLIRVVGIGQIAVGVIFCDGVRLEEPELEE